MDLTFAKITSSIIAATSFIDSTVCKLAQTYYYVCATVDSSNNESSSSNTATVVVPAP